MFDHGGDYTGKYLDFSTSVAPFGPPESVLVAVGKCLTDGSVGCYPDPDCHELRRAIATYEGVSPDMVVCGNGAADLIWRAVRTCHPNQALVVEPTFSEYRKALDSIGCITFEHRLSPEKGFCPTESILSDLSEELDLVVLCAPNNPTGKNWDPHLFYQVISKCALQKTRVLVDASFLELACGPKTYRHIMTDYVQKWPGLMVLKSFTKLYAMPGIRLGYLLSSSEQTVRALLEEAPPWQVSSMAQAAGVAALKDTDYAKQVQDYLKKERYRVMDALEETGFLVLWEKDELGADLLKQENVVFASDANFFLLHLSIPGASEKLKEKDILVRDCSSFPGLNSHYIRFALRKHSENMRLVKAIEEVLAGE